MNEDRGVSEVLGYVLVIALVTVLISVVMTVGFDGLERAQASEQLSNMERGFDVLSHNMEKVADREAPSRATELRIADGSLSYGEPTTINVTVDGELIDNLSVVTEPIVYDSESGTQIVYESGAIIRTDGDRSTMLNDPRFVLTDDKVVLGGIRTRPLAGSESAITDPGTVLIRTEYLSTNVAHEANATGELNISIESKRADAWERYFRDQGYENVTREDQHVTVSVSAQSTTVSVLQTRIRITLVD